jgi:hypothetical protein
LYHQGKPVNTISADVLANPVFAARGNGLFVAQADTLIDLVRIKTGDWVKLDKAGPDECLRAAKQISSYNNADSLWVSIFDLQPAAFFKYDTSAIQKIYSAFR